MFVVSVEIGRFGPNLRAQSPYLLLVGEKLRTNSECIPPHAPRRRVGDPTATRRSSAHPRPPRRSPCPSLNMRHMSWRAGGHQLFGQTVWV